MKTVTFSLSLGREYKEDTCTFEELGIDESRYENEKELEKAIQEAYEDWVWGNIDSTWYIDED